MNRNLGALLLLPVISACSGGGGGVTPAAIPQQPSITQPQSEQVSTPSMVSTENVAKSYDNLYVSNSNNSITVYNHDDQGNRAPKYVIAGSNTGLKAPGALSEDAQGNLYVANYDSLLVFAHGANGNVKPIRILSGPATGIHQIGAMTVDKITGKIFVSDTIPMPMFPSSSILRFPPNANGNQAPFARSTAAADIFSFASDSTGNSLIVGSSGSEENVGLDITTVYKQFANGTSLQSTYNINRISASSIADDPSNKTYYIRPFFGGNGILHLAEKTTDRYDGYNLTFTPPVINNITDDCGSAIALGYISRIYSIHSTATYCSADAVYVYNPDANGNATPVRILSGPATGLNKPLGIYEGK